MAYFILPFILTSSFNAHTANRIVAKNRNDTVDSYNELQVMCCWEISGRQTYLLAVKHSRSVQMASDSGSN